MAASFESAVTSYVKARSLSTATGVEYRSTLSKWSAWGKGVPLASIGRSEVREFLDWVHERAVENEGTNPGRTANKCREHLRAVLSWAWEEELVATLPRFPKTKLQRDIAADRIPIADQRSRRGMSMLQTKILNLQSGQG